ncbi:MAG: hypothetical protein Q4E74_00815 [Ruminococcus sp.]|nr:hypothetical protein [Ruminococcus sp.]
MSRLSEQEKNGIISVCRDMLRLSDYDADKAKQELKRSIERADTLKYKDFVYGFFANAVDIISQSGGGILNERTDEDETNRSNPTVTENYRRNNETV